MSRRPAIVAGNWKMHLKQEAGIYLAEQILKSADEVEGAQLLLFPPFIHLSAIHALMQAHARSHVGLGAQNMHHMEQGAYTGEISAAMLQSVGCQWVLIGHSERRQLFHEDHAWLARKVRQALDTGLTPVYCCGEDLEERDQGRTADVVERQIREGLFALSGREVGRVLIAYEPVWAIGTGRTATPDQAQEVHAQIRGLIGEQYEAALADRIPILYGGSVKPGNAAALFEQADIDGALVGGASLQAEDFLTIARAGLQKSPA